MCSLDKTLEGNTRIDDIKEIEFSTLFAIVIFTLGNDIQHRLQFFREYINFLHVRLHQLRSCINIKLKILINVGVFSLISQKQYVMNTWKTITKHTVLNTKIYSCRPTNFSQLIIPELANCITIYETIQWNMYRKSYKYIG